LINKASYDFIYLSATLMTFEPPEVPILEHILGGNINVKFFRYLNRCKVRR